MSDYSADHDLALMIPRSAYHELGEKYDHLLDLLTHAFGLVCNVDNGNFEHKQSPEWIEAARKFLDDVHEAGVYKPNKE